MGDVVDFEEKKPVWASTYNACIHCAFHYVGVVHKDTINQFLECPKCGELRSLVLKIFRDGETY